MYQFENNHTFLPKLPLWIGWCPLNLRLVLKKAAQLIDQLKSGGRSSLKKNTHYLKLLHFKS